MFRFRPARVAKSRSAMLGEETGDGVVGALAIDGWGG